MSPTPPPPPTKRWELTFYPIKTQEVSNLLSHPLRDSIPSSQILDPHLIVVPASVLDNWAREFSKFAPDLEILKYHGSQAHRKDIQSQIRREMNIPGTKVRIVGKVDPKNKTAPRRLNHTHPVTNSLGSLFIMIAAPRRRLDHVHLLLLREE